MPDPRQIETIKGCQTVTRDKRKRTGEVLLVSLILAPFALLVTVLALMEWPPHLFGEATKGEHVKVVECTGEVVSYCLEYDYWVDGVRYYKFFEEISLKWYRQLPNSDTLTALYLPSAPHVVRIEGNISYRNGLTAFACWLDVFVFGIFGLMGISAKSPPKTERGKHLVSCILVGELVMVVGTVLWWVGELAITGSSWGFTGLGIGMLAGGVAALYTWRTETVLAFM